MCNIKSFKVVVLASVLLLQPMVGSFALAKKKSPPKAYSFIAEGGKASQGECDGVRKVPRKLKKVSEYSKTGSYMGSELQTPEVGAKPNEEMWVHLFRDKGTCNSILAKTPSALAANMKDGKRELPPDDSVDSDDDSDKDSDSKDDAGPSEGADAE